MSERTGPGSKVLTGGLVALGIGVLGLCTCCGCGLLGWSEFVRFGMGTDIDDYRTYISESNLDDPERNELYARLDRIDAGIRDREIRISFFVWVDINGDIERLAADRELPPDELSALHDQLNRIEAYR